jgi:cell division septation protein DedD
LKPSVPGGRPVAWEDAGWQIAPVLGSYSAVLVTSSDPVAAAHVALGIARAEAKQRRVVVGDLVGDLPSLRSLVKDEDPHGISDSFLYGVSLNKIGYNVEGTANLAVMPSGTDPTVGEEIFRSPRWKKLAEGATERGALLLLVARSDAPGLADLADQLDGVVLVRDPELRGAPSSLVLSRVPGPTPTLKIPLHRISARAADWKKHKWLYPAIGAAALLVIGGAGFAFMLANAAKSPPTRARAAGTPSPVRSDSTTAPALAAATPAPVPPPPRPAPETLYIAPPANVNDSAAASAFTVELLSANTAEGANLFVRRNGAELPAAAVSPVLLLPERTTWYRVTAGAYTRRDQADSLLLALRRSSVLADSAGTVTRAPLALLVDSVPTQGGIVDAIREAVQKYTARGLPVYALIQSDGGARIYAGAFAAADQSAGLIRTLRGAGLKPVLVYRTGSTP